MLVDRRIKIVVEQNVIDKPSPVEEFPMRKWSMKIYLLDEEGQEHTADVFTKVTYNLHPSFEDPTQTFHTPPFTCSNEGWGEFELGIDLYTTEKTKITPTIIQDLNFAQNKYEAIHPIVIKNPSQALQEKLRETGPLPTDEGRKKGVAGAINGASGKKASQKYDYEKIADALQKLEEEDLLRVIQMINENKGPDTYIRSDVDGKHTISTFLCSSHRVLMEWANSG
ncbi:putative transcription initiation factor IIF 30K chain [Emericellopsis atlantica]|uniref:Transcription initiation factor IIF 30K chain n=1 Tax=Emericellopsis atlantica TaxID=2614577 RepID=A0A9P8CMY9_9HYPO|nr:putative transcription initiation factor IIF 30K chain [Emericellopsis atlantica]KAG9252612.1 putative transcription initiation factor IIF 30K chain [Emericellopsis atlantica]